MTTTETPGVCVQHVIISQDCIKLHGTFGAYREGINRIEKEYLNLVDVWHNSPHVKGVKYHIVLTIERPKTIKTMSNDPKDVVDLDGQETKLDMGDDKTDFHHYDLGE